MADNPLADLGGTVVQDAPNNSNPLADLGGTPVQSTPIDNARGYLSGLNNGQELPATWQDHYKAGQAFFDQSPAARLGSGIADVFSHPINSAETVLSGAGGLLSNAYNGLQSFGKEQANSAAAHPLTAFPRMAYAAGVGGITGLYNLGDTINSASDKVGSLVDSIDPTAPSVTGRQRAYADYATRQQAAKTASVEQSIADSTGQPATFAVGENVAPLAVPFAPGIEATALATRLGAGLTDALTPAARLVSVSPQAASTGIGIGDAAAIGSHFVPGGHFLRGLIRAGQALADDAPEASNGLRTTGPRLAVPYQGAAKAAEETANLASNLSPAVPSNAAIAAGQVATAGTNALAAGGTGALYGLAGAPTGDEEDAALQGFGGGLALSPAAVIAGGFARQNLAEATKNSALEKTGASKSTGTDLVSPEKASIINRLQGAFAGAKTADGNPIRYVVQSPEDYSTAANLANGGTVEDAANSRGFYNHDTGTIHLNAADPDLLGTLHETGHAVMSALTGIDTAQAESLNQSIAKSSLQNGRPTPNFQRFMDEYNGGNPVDWNALPENAPADAPGSPSKNYYLHEVGAQTTAQLADLNNPAKAALPPELSDVVFNALGDYARKKGIVSTPNILQGIGDPNAAAVPADPAALRASQQAFQTVASQPSSSVNVVPDATPARSGLGYQMPAPEPGLSIPARPATRAVAPRAPGTLPDGSLATPTQPAAPLPAATFRQSQAYQDALAVATLPKKNGGLGVDPVSAQAALDRAAQDSSVPDNVTSYVGYVQKAQNPVAAPQPADSGVTTSLTPSPFPNVPTVSPQAKRIYLLPGGPGGAKRIELPQAQPVMTLPTAEPVAQRVALPKAEPVNRFAGMEEPPVTGPTDKQLSPDLPLANTPPESAQVSPPLPEQSTDDTGHGDNTATSSPDAQTQGVADTSRAVPSSSDVTPDTSAPASPLSSEDIARIESEAEKNFTYTGPKPAAKTLASNPNELADRTAAALAKAKQDAVAKAHLDALPDGDTRVRAQVDPDTGGITLKGTHFVEGDAFHDQLLRNATDGEKANLSTVQDAIGQGKALNVDYDSALPLRGEDTNAQRQESQALSTASDREQGVGLAQEANHTFVPLSASPTASGHAQVYGYAPDKVLGNAETAIRLMRDSGLSDRLPYTGINDPSLTRDIRAYTENHVNGYKGDGSAKLQPTEGVNVPAGDPNYQPQPLPPAEAHFINLIMGQDDTLSQKQAVKTGPNSGKPTNSATLRNFAAANDNVPSASGEVNPLRDELNRKGVLKVGNDKGSGEVLHSAFENIKPGLITRFHDQPGTSDVPPLRASSFEGDRGSIAPGGKVPNRQASAAGFLPAREAGATPEQAADAAKQWREKGTDSPYFKNWFGDSKAVNEDGKPMVVYHGTSKKFDTFDPEKSGGLMYFSDSKDYASDFGSGKIVKSYINASKPFYAPDETSLTAPEFQKVLSDKGVKLSDESRKIIQEVSADYDHDPRPFWSWLRNASDPLSKDFQKAGYDSIFQTEGGENAWAVFKPEQIKSATNNNGQFNPKDPRISFLPAREAGAATPEQKLGILPSIVRSGETIPGTTGRAAEDLPVQRFGNATVTGAGTQFLPAYHGTPHEVDRFDSSKIGTGEGAQVYGHGLYFAQNRNVAETYARDLSSEDLYDGRRYNPQDATHMAAHLVSNMGDRTEAENFARSYKYGTDDQTKVLRDAANHIASGTDAKVHRPSGNLYTVDINTNPDKLLDWDKPLTGKLLEKAKEIGATPRLGETGITGASLYSAVKDAIGSGKITGFPSGMNRAESASAYIRDSMAIPGIRYLDQGSRGDGTGTYNYVMFDDSKIKITHKNDAPIPQG